MNERQTMQQQDESEGGAVTAKSHASPSSESFSNQAVSKKKGIGDRKSASSFSSYMPALSNKGVMRASTGVRRRVSGMKRSRQTLNDEDDEDEDEEDGNDEDDKDGMIGSKSSGRSGVKARKTDSGKGRGRRMRRAMPESESETESEEGKCESEEEEQVRKEEEEEEQGEGFESEDESSDEDEREDDDEEYRPTRRGISAASSPSSRSRSSAPRRGSASSSSRSMRPKMNDEGKLSIGYERVESGMSSDYTSESDAESQYVAIAGNTGKKLWPTAQPRERRMKMEGKNKTQPVVSKLRDEGPPPAALNPMQVR